MRLVKLQFGLRKKTEKETRSSETFLRAVVSGDSGSYLRLHKFVRAGATIMSIMETVNAGHMMSLAALQRQDPYINKLLDVTGQVALYNFNSKANEWVSLYVTDSVLRKASKLTSLSMLALFKLKNTKNVVIFL